MQRNSKTQRRSTKQAHSTKSRPTSELNRTGHHSTPHNTQQHASIATTPTMPQSTTTTRRRPHSTFRLRRTSASRFSTSTTSPGGKLSTTSTTLPVPKVDLKKAKAVPIYSRDEPASLEFFHFSDPKWRKSSPNQFLSQKDPFQLMLQHPVGQVVISQWIGNHISLHLRHVLAHPETQITTKNGKSLLVGYDINSEYVKDIHGNLPDEMDASDPRHVQNKTKLIVSPHNDPPQWNTVPFADYGYALFDPTVPAYDIVKEQYDVALEKHQKWAKLCGVDDETALKQELGHRDQFQNSDSAGDTLALLAARSTTPTNTQQQALLLQSTPASHDDLSQLKLKEMTLPQQAQYVGQVSTQAALGTAKLLYVLTARTTQLVTPGGAKTIYKELTKGMSPQWFMEKVYNGGRYVSIALIRGARAIYNKIDSVFQSKIPFLNRFFRSRVDAVAGNLVAVGTPVLDSVHHRIGQVNRAAGWVDEWLGTEYKNHPNLKKLNDSRKLEILLELSPHPGNAPTPPKGSPYQNEIAPTAIFNRIGVDRKGSTIEDLLHAAEIDDHRLLLSYIHRLRNTSKLTIGLCPDHIEIPQEYYKPRINAKGMLETPITSPPATPELALLSVHNDTIHEQAGLRKDPDVWLSKRLLDKIPSPDLLDLAHTIKSIDPSFSIPKTLIQQRRAEGEDDDANARPQSQFSKTAMEVMRGLGFGFVIGSVVYEGYLISGELGAAFQQFPDVPKGDLVQDYFKFYFMRMKYSTTALLDTAWYGITNHHMFAEYEDNQFKQAQEDHYFSSAVPNDQQPSHQRRSFNEAELKELLRSVEMQLESDLTKNNGEQQPYTILNADQAAALMQFNENQNAQVLALSQNHSASIPHVSTQQQHGVPVHFQSLTEDEINEIEQSNPNLKAQVSHPFGISQQDLVDIEAITREMTEKHEDTQ